MKTAVTILLTLFIFSSCQSINTRKTDSADPAPDSTDEAKYKGTTEFSIDMDEFLKKLESEFKLFGGPESSGKALLNVQTWEFKQKVGYEGASKYWTGDLKLHTTAEVKGIYGFKIDQIHSPIKIDFIQGGDPLSDYPAILIVLPPPQLLHVSVIEDTVKHKLTKDAILRDPDHLEGIKNRNLRMIRKNIAYKKMKLWADQRHKPLWDKSREMIKELYLPFCKGMNDSPHIIVKFRSPGWAGGI